MDVFHWMDQKRKCLQSMVTASDEFLNSPNQMISERLDRFERKRATALKLLTRADDELSDAIQRAKRETPQVIQTDSFQEQLKQKVQEEILMLDLISKQDEKIHQVLEREKKRLQVELNQNQKIQETQEKFKSRPFASGDSLGEGLDRTL